EAEGAAAAQQLVCVAFEGLDVRAAREPCARERGPLRVLLDREDGARSLGHRRRALAERGAGLGDVASGGEHPQQGVHRGDRAPAAGQSSARGNERCRRGGTRKFCLCVVVSTELKPCARERCATSSFAPFGSTPSIASRLRSKSSPVGLNTTKWTPAAGSVLNLSTA